MVGEKLSSSLFLVIYFSISLTICMLGNFFHFPCFLLLSADFFSKKKIFQEHHQSVKQFGSRLGPTFCPDLGPNCLYQLSADDKNRPCACLKVWHFEFWNPVAQLHIHIYQIPKFQNNPYSGFWELVPTKCGRKEKSTRRRYRSKKKRRLINDKRLLTKISVFKTTIITEDILSKLFIKTY